MKAYSANSSTYSYHFAHPANWEAQDWIARSCWSASWWRHRCSCCSSSTAADCRTSTVAGSSFTWTSFLESFFGSPVEVAGATAWIYFIGHSNQQAASHYSCFSIGQEEASRQPYWRYLLRRRWICQLTAGAFWNPFSLASCSWKQQAPCREETRALLLGFASGFSSGTPRSSYACDWKMRVVRSESSLSHLEMWTGWRRSRSSGGRSAGPSASRCRALSPRKWSHFQTFERKCRCWPSGCNCSISVAC